MTPKQHKARREREVKRIYALLSDIDHAHSQIDKLLHDGELANEFHTNKFESDLDEVALNLEDLAQQLTNTADVVNSRLLQYSTERR